MIEKARSMGFRIKEVYGDGHYNNFKNWAILSVIYGIDCYFNMPEGVKIKPEGTLPRIQKKYQSYHNEVDWIPTDNEYKMMKYLIEKGHSDYVGGYFKNRWYRIWRYHKDEYKKIKGKRSICENTNSILKEQMLFEKNIDGKGWKKLKIYGLQFMIAMVTVALIRAENGVRDGFMKVSDGVFS